MRGETARTTGQLRMFAELQDSNPLSIKRIEA
jgi:hypothetical protein